MIIYVENPKESIKKSPGTINAIIAQLQDTGLIFKRQLFSYQQ